MPLLAGPLGRCSDMTQSEDSGSGTGRILITTSDGGHLTLLTAPTAFAGNAVNGVRGGMASSLGTFPGATETVYIAASGRPLPVRVLANIPGRSETTCTFSRWGEPVDLTAPPKLVPLGSVIGGSTTS